jgi:16S rRNA C967 or C1407 C5-methylase (RsmB/RsmF family)/NOL1/NOP2/fmu family ribosome biogenesis protein
MNTDKNFPIEFENRIKNDAFLGEKLLEALNLDAPTSIRCNKSKIEGNLLPIDAAPIPWTENAYYLKERPIFTLDPLFHAGLYYPQEAGSMFLEKVLNQLPFPENPIMLDLCAAPGGKSTLITSFLDNKGLLLSNEVINSRAKILKENLTKWGYSNTLVSNNDPKDFQRVPNFFDCIVIDAPCSGEGMFRKDLAARNEWSESNVDLCSGRQKRIVMDVWSSLKPGGFLIYSTCTFNTQENEENVSWFKENLSCEHVNLDFHPLQKDRNEFGAYALPHLLESEGFYIVVLQKEALDFRPTKFKNTNRQIKQVKESKFLSKFVDLSNKKIIEWNNILFAIPEKFSQEIIELHEQLRLLKMGTELGTSIREELIPVHALALDATSNLYSQKVEVSKEQALHFQKGETFELQAAKGYNLLTFEGVNLGWIKHLGNRFNNLYPKEWRIRMKIEGK